MDIARLDGIRIGTATSSYQIEGAADRDGRGPSIWDVFAREPGAIADGSTGARGSGHYDRLDEDLDLLAWLGVDVYRFSIAWPRVQPGGTGRPNPPGLGFYDRLVDGLLERGITPFATLYHWDLPAELQERGGWTDRDTAGRFADYAEIAVRRLGDRVPAWATLNEPWCSAHLGHQAGVHAPGVADDEAAVHAAHHLLLAHGLAVPVLRSLTDGDVGIVLNPAPVWPASDDEADRDAARRLDGVVNRWWLDALVHGRYPADVLDAFDAVADLTVIRADDARTIAAPIDLLGVNYYFPQVAAAARPGRDGARPPGPGLDGVVSATADGDTTMLGWPIRPEGFTEILTRIHRDWSGPPLWVTENGAAYDDAPAPDGTVADPARIAYLDAHLSALADARDAGADIRGYLVWSLLDNFEWAEGYPPRFGLIHVDYDTMERTPKDSAHWLRDLLLDR